MKTRRCNTVKSLNALCMLSIMLICTGELRTQETPLIYAFAAEGTILKELETKYADMDDANHGKYMKLRKAGFTANAKARHANALAEDIKKLREKMRLITHYRNVYSLHPFLDEDGVKAICDKYDLVLGEASDFIGEIPERNIQEIIEFKLNVADAGSSMKNYAPHTLTGFGYTVTGGVDTVFRIDLFQPQLFKVADGNTVVIDRTESEPKAEYEPDFLVVAPENQFELDRVERDGHRMVDKDPIILHAVKGGYLVVTAWGPEAGEIDKLRRIRARQLIAKVE